MSDKLQLVESLELDGASFQIISDKLKFAGHQGRFPEGLLSMHDASTILSNNVLAETINEEVGRFAATLVIPGHQDEM